MLQYIIYTENKNLEKIKSLLNDYFKGYTIINIIGYWKKQKEKSIKIEIITSKENDFIIKGIIRKIKVLNNQESVLLTVKGLLGVHYL